MSSFRDIQLQEIATAFDRLYKQSSDDHVPIGLIELDLTDEMGWCDSALLAEFIASRGLQVQTFCESDDEFDDESDDEFDDPSREYQGVIGITDRTNFDGAYTHTLDLVRVDLKRASAALGKHMNYHNSYKKYATERIRMLKEQVCARNRVIKSLEESLTKDEAKCSSD